MLGTVSHDDGRIKRLTRYTGYPFVYYYKSLAGKVPISAHHALLILENKEGATKEEAQEIKKKIEAAGGKVELK